jgi:hypothetical protein
LGWSSGQLRFREWVLEWWKRRSKQVSVGRYLDVSLSMFLSLEVRIVIRWSLIDYI